MWGPQEIVRGLYDSRGLGLGFGVPDLGFRI